MSEGRVASLFIDGAWVASGDGTCSPVIDPSDGSVVTEVDVATDEQVQAAIAAARRAFDETDWPRSSTGERAALLDRVGRSPRTGPGGARARGDPEHRQGSAREPLRYRGRDPCLPVLRRPGGRGGGAPRGDGRPDRPESHRVRARRGVRADRAVELPVAAAVLEDRPGTRGGLHRSDEARASDPADGDPPDAPARGGRYPAWRREPGPRRGRAGRTGAGRLAAGRPDLAHRRDRGGARTHARRSGKRQEGRPGARRQEPEHRLRRCRLRDRRR